MLKSVQFRLNWVTRPARLPASRQQDARRWMICAPRAEWVSSGGRRLERPTSIHHDHNAPDLEPARQCASPRRRHRHSWTPAGERGRGEIASFDAADEIDSRFGRRRCVLLRGCDGSSVTFLLTSWARPSTSAGRCLTSIRRHGPRAHPHHPRPRLGAPTPTPPGSASSSFTPGACLSMTRAGHHPC